MEAALLSAVVLACPVGMGLMMWFMAKGMPKDAAATPAPLNSPAATQPAVDRSVEQLREEHQRLGAEIERLEDQQGNRVLNRS